MIWLRNVVVLQQSFEKVEEQYFPVVLFKAVLTFLSLGIKL